MTTKTTEPATKTEQLIAACRTAKGATAAQLVEATGQTTQVIRSRIYTLTKAGRIEAVDGSSPRRYRAIPKKTTTTTSKKTK